MRTEELTALGLTDEQATSVLAMAGRDIEKHKATARDLETERDDLRTRLTTAESTIARFEGVDPDALRGEVEKYKKQAEDAEKTYTRKIETRDKHDWISKKLDEYGVHSPYARKQLAAEAMSSESGLSWKDGSFFGFDDFMRAAKTADPSLYETAEEKQAREAETEKAGKAPKIVGKTGNEESGKRRFAPPVLW